MKRIAILGSTGSIGRSTLSVVESNPGRFQVITMAAGSNVEAALEQALRWKPKVLSLALEQDADVIRKELKAEGLEQIEVVHGRLTIRKRERNSITQHPNAPNPKSGARSKAANRDARILGWVVPIGNREARDEPQRLVEREVTLPWPHGVGCLNGYGEG